MEAQRSRHRDRAPRSRLGSSRSSPRSSLGSSREDRDRGHEAVLSPSSESQRSQQELSRISLLLEQSSESLTREQRNLVELSVAVLREDIIRARKFAKKLEDIEIDRMWEELAELEALKNPDAQKLPGPLHLAAQSGYQPMCKFLIYQCKCNVNASMIDGKTPLMFARDETIVKYLVNNHADLNKGDNFGITPLHVAATQGCYEIAEYLLSKGANVDPLCQDGESPLFCAAIQGDERMVTLLLKHNADYNRLSKKLVTPLLASLHGSSLNCLEILIEAGADVNGVGCSVPPVALAAYKGLDSCILCLLKNGANPNVPDEDNNIPVQIAAVKGWKKCVEILLPHSPHLTQYEGLSISEIIQWERTVSSDPHFGTKYFHFSFVA